MAEKTTDGKTAKDMVAKADLTEAKIVEYEGYDRKFVLSVNRLGLTETYYGTDKEGKEIPLASDKRPLWYVESRYLGAIGVDSYYTVGSVAVASKSDESKFKSMVADVRRFEDRPREVIMVAYYDCKIGSETARRVTIYAHGGALSVMFPLLAGIERAAEKLNAQENKRVKAELALRRKDNQTSLQDTDLPIIRGRGDF